MSEYYGYLTGCRGTATRCGSKGSGIHAHIRSWNNDVYADLGRDNDNKDFLRVTIPKGLRTNINGIEIEITEKGIKIKRVKQ